MNYRSAELFLTENSEFYWVQATRQVIFDFTTPPPCFAPEDNNLERYLLGRRAGPFREHKDAIAFIRLVEALLKLPRPTGKAENCDVVVSITTFFSASPRGAAWLRSQYEARPIWSIRGPRFWELSSGQVIVSFNSPDWMFGEEFEMGRAGIRWMFHNWRANACPPIEE